MAPDITPHYIGVDGRLVHFVRGGTGPAIAMLHGSPQSHVALLPLMRRLMPRFTVFAFDTPGYGASDPLPDGGADIEAFGDALAATLRALGLGPIPVYGTHTGASIALAAANRHPGVVSRAVLDGFAMFTAAERDALLRDHMPLVAPAWDGGHLVALWSRIRDQSMFFPWFDRRDQTRRASPPPPVSVQHQALLDLLHAGAHYRVAYGASISQAASALTQAPSRVRLFCRADDVLVSHLARLPDGFPAAQAQVLDGDAAFCASAIAEALAGAVSVPASCPAASGCDEARGYAAGLHFRATGQGRPLVLLHDLPGSSCTALADAAALAVGRRVVAFDLPGCGFSPPHAGQDDPDTLAALLAAALRSLGLADFDIAGLGVGARLAADLAQHAKPRRLAQLAAVSDGLADTYPLDVTPRWDGGHLLSAWFRQRDALLFFPWFDRGGPLPLPPAVDLDALQMRVTAILEMRGPDATAALLRRPAERAGACFDAAPDMAARALAWLDQ